MLQTLFLKRGEQIPDVFTTVFLKIFYKIANGGYTVCMKSKDQPLYRRWIAMRSRCNDPAHHRYKNYGGRGIKVCERWGSYKNFIEDMGLPPFPGATLDRIDNDGPYSPENVQWATRATQGKNRRNNRWLTAHGETLTVADWARKTGLQFSTIAARLRYGKTPEAAVAVEKPAGWRKTRVNKPK